MLKKFANATITLGKDSLVEPERALHSEAITERFKTITAEIKKISPRSQDFLYFIARGIHAMEHAAIDPVSRKYEEKIGHIAYDNGHGKCKVCDTVLVKSAGNPISGLWCKSSTVEPFVNQNGDAFSEQELLADVKDLQDPTKTIKAYQTFIGKGLFTDHKSSEVENIRGIILDAAYDHASKGVDLLIALDKVAYPELARQITAGYSTDVSMGCQVNYSLCSDCGNKAVTEADYCSHVRTAKGIARAGSNRCYEINNGLNFIEISMVSNGADPRAKIKTVLASLNRLRQAQNLDDKTLQNENQLILDSISRIESEVRDLESQISREADTEQLNIIARMAKIENQVQAIAEQLKIGGKAMAQDVKQNKKAYMQGTQEPELGKTFEMSDKNYTDHWEQDKHLHGQGMESGSDGLHPGYGLGSDEDVKKMYQRASSEERRKMRAALLQKLSYMQGTSEPEPGKPFQMSDKNYKDHWEEDKHMVGQGMESGSDGAHPGYGMGSDEQVKKELLRAKIRARLLKSANPKQCAWQVFAGNEPILSVTAEQAYGDELNQPAEDVDAERPVTNFEWFASKPYGINLIQAIKQFGLQKVAAQIASASQVRTAQAAPAAPAPEAPAAAAPAAPAPEVPAGETQEHAEGQLQAAEAIRTAVDQIEEAATQIVSMVDDIESEYGAGAAQEGEALAGDLAEAGSELGELGGEMAAGAPSPTQAAALNGLVKMALAYADETLARAEVFVDKYAKKKHKKEDKKEEKEDKKKKMAGKMPEALKEYWEDKKEKSEDKEDEKEDKKEAKASAQRLAARRALRHKLAEQLYGLTDGDMIAEAHPEGGNDSTFPGQPQGKVETVTEQQEADIDVAHAAPRGELVARKALRQKVLQAAKKLAEGPLAKAEEGVAKAKQTLVDTAKQVAKNKSTVEPKVSTAEVDKETKQYYAELASESATGAKADPEVKKFYSDLTSDFQKKKATAEAHNVGLKMKRAYAVAMKRASLGQIDNSRDALEADVDRLMLLSDEQFTHFADVIENTKKVSQVETKKKQVRTAGALNVGVAEGNSTGVSPVEAVTSELAKLPWS